MKHDSPARSTDVHRASASVELAKVLLDSSIIDGAAWEARLNELIASSTVQKKVVTIAHDDFTKSFRR